MSGLLPIRGATICSTLDVNHDPAREIHIKRIHPFRLLQFLSKYEQPGHVLYKESGPTFPCSVKILGTWTLVRHSAFHHKQRSIRAKLPQRVVVPGSAVIALSQCLRQKYVDVLPFGWLSGGIAGSSAHR